MRDKPTFSDRDCTYCEGVPATHRARWTVYGGGTQGAYVCEKHAFVAKHQRGIELIALPREPRTPSGKSRADLEIEREDRRGDFL